MPAKGKNRKRMLRAMFGLLSLLLCCAAPLQAQEDGGACAACHSTLGGDLTKPVTDWRGSIHDQNGITCDLCHGGNADVKVGKADELSEEEFSARQAAAMDKAAGFVGKPTGRAQFDLCAQCHPDSVSRYATSIMGKAYLGNKGGPSCVACHQTHHNEIPAVPKTCTGCHKDTTGFDQIDPMAVSEATIAQLATIRIHLAGEKARGKRPALAPSMPAELDSYKVGLVAFGGVVILFLLGWLVMAILEKEKKK